MKTSGFLVLCGVAGFLIGHSIGTLPTHFLCVYGDKTEVHKIGPSTTPHLEGNDNCKKVRL